MTKAEEAYQEELSKATESELRVLLLSCDDAAKEMEESRSSLIEEIRELGIHKRRIQTELRERISKGISKDDVLRAMKEITWELECHPHIATGSFPLCLSGSIYELLDALGVRGRGIGETRLPDTLIQELADQFPGLTLTLGADIMIAPASEHLSTGKDQVKAYMDTGFRIDCSKLESFANNVGERIDDLRAALNDLKTATKDG